MRITMKYGTQALRGEEVEVKFERYETGTPAIVLCDPTDGEVVTVASVNFPGRLAKDEVALKGWSENEGVPEDLLANGIVTPAHRHIASGFVIASVHKIARRE